MESGEQQEDLSAVLEEDLEEEVDEELEEDGEPGPGEEEFLDEVLPLPLPPPFESSNTTQHLGSGSGSVARSGQKSEVETHGSPDSENFNHLQSKRNHSHSQKIKNDDLLHQLEPSKKSSCINK